MPRFYLVDIESITCDEPRSKFAIEQVNELAQSIAAIGSLIRPLTLEATSRQTYRLISGALEYYAAVRASEINPDIEMVDAFVVEPEQIAKVQEQLMTLGSLISTPGSGVDSDSDSDSGSDSGSGSDLDLRLNNLEARLEQAIQELKSASQQQVQELKEAFKALEQKLPPPLPEPLDLFNKLPEIDLLKALHKVRITGKTANTIITNLVKARSESPFTSYEDVVSRTNQLSEKRMLMLLDLWSGLS